MGAPALRSSWRRPHGFNAEFVKERGYHDQGILVVEVNDPRLSWDQRLLLKQIGDKLFGPRAEVRA